MQSANMGNGLRTRPAGGAPNSKVQYRRPPDKPSYGGGANPYLGGGMQSFPQGQGGSQQQGGASASPYLGAGARRAGNPGGNQPASPYLGGGDYSAYRGQRRAPGGIGSAQQSANQMPDYSQRDAFIQRLNDTMAGYQGNQGVYQGQGAPPPSWGRPPQFNFPQLWQDAGQMVSNGWRNPLLGLLG